MVLDFRVRYKTLKSYWVRLSKRTCTFKMWHNEASKISRLPNTRFPHSAIIKILTSNMLSFPDPKPPQTQYSNRHNQWKKVQDSIEIYLLITLTCQELYLQMFQVEGITRHISSKHSVVKICVVQRCSVCLHFFLQKVITQLLHNNSFCQFRP